MMCMSSGSLGGASRVRKRARLFWVGHNSDHKRIHDDTFQIRSVKVLTWDFLDTQSRPRRVAMAESGSNKRAASSAPFRGAGSDETSVEELR